MAVEFETNREIFWTSAVVLWADLSLLSKSVLNSPRSRAWWGVIVAVLVGACFLFIRYQQPRSWSKRREWYESENPLSSPESVAYHIERRAVDTEIQCLMFSVILLVIEVMALLSVPNEGIL